MRFIAWAFWQLFTLAFALLVWANLFGDYGQYPDRSLSAAALVVALTFAVVAGTIIPWRRWRAADRKTEPDVTKKMHGN